MTFAELCKVDERQLRALRRTAGTVRAFLQHADDLIGFCEGEVGLWSVLQLTPTVLEARFKSLRNRGLKRATFYSRQRAIRTWLTWALERGILLTDPARDFHQPCPLGAEPAGAYGVPGRALVGRAVR